MNDNGSLQIFSPFGSFSRHFIAPQGANVAYITISKAGGDDIILGYAPITGVDIRQLTDFSVTKSLNRDFLVATFGDTPVQITIKGLNFFNLNGCALKDDDVGSREQIMDFYKQNKLSAAPYDRFDVAITKSGETAVSFRCVIVGLDTQNESTTDGTSNLFYRYTMSLIGVDSI